MLSILHRCDAWGNDCQRELHLLKRKAPPVFRGKQCALGVDSFSFFSLFFLFWGEYGAVPVVVLGKKIINNLLMHSLIYNFFKVLILMWHRLQHFSSFSLYSPWWPFMFKGHPYRKLRDRLDFYIESETILFSWEPWSLGRIVLKLKNSFVSDILIWSRISIASG